MCGIFSTGLDRGEYTLHFSDFTKYSCTNRIIAGNILLQLQLSYLQIKKYLEPRLIDVLTTWTVLVFLQLHLELIFVEKTSTVLIMRGERQSIRRKGREEERIVDLK